MIFRFLVRATALMVALLTIGEASAQGFSWRMTNYGVESEQAGIARQSLAFDGNGGVYALEYIAAFDGIRARVGRYAVADGNRVWQTDVPASAYLPGYWEIGFDPAGAALARAGNDVAVASTIAADSAFRGQVTKLKGNDGSVLWRATDAGAVTVGYDAIAVDAAGDIVAAGSSGIDTGYDVSGRVGKYRGSDGGALWQVTIDATSCGGGRTFTLTAAAVDPGGDVLVAGESIYYSSGQTVVFCVIKLAGHNGDVLWSRGFVPASGVGGSAVAALTLDASGNVLAFGKYAPLNGGSLTGALIKFDAASGDILWADDNLPYGIGFLVADAAGNALLSSSGTQKYAAADGHAMWSAPAPHTGALALDGNGNLLVAQNDATDPNVSSGRKMDFFSLDPLDGSQRWTSSLPLGTVPYWDGSEVIAIDAAGHFASLQAISGFCCELDHALLAMGDVSDGSILWQASDRGLGPSNSYVWADVFQPMFNHKTTMLTPDGNIVAVGMAFLGEYGSSFSYTSARIMTVKRSSQDGHLLWRAVADAGLDRCEPASIAVDANGDVVVAGHCEQTPVTVKYRGSDGAQLWMGTNLDTCLRAGAYAVDADAAGDVYASGWCDDATEENQLTVKYAGDSGAVRWARHTQGGSTGLGGSAMYVAVAGANVAVSSSLPVSGDFVSMVVNSLRASDGMPQWSQHFDPPAGASYHADALMAFANGDVFASGARSAWRLYASTGNIRWTNTTMPGVRALAKDANDDLYFVAGDAIGKLHGNSGIPAWTTLDDAGGRGARLDDVAVGATGEVLATGSALGNYLNLHVASFDASNGSMRWSANDTAVIYDVGAGIVPAPDGGAFVTADYAAGDDLPSWTLVRVNPPGADSIFLNGWEE